MIRTMTAMLFELGKIRDRFSSTDIPISVDGRWIDSIEVVTDGRYEVVINTKRCMDADSGLPHCPNCGSYNYEVAFIVQPTTASAATAVHCSFGISICR